MGGLAGSDGGEAGADTDPEGSASLVPANYGAVRLLIDGKPVCGGTLHTNSWVLTADRCLPLGTDPGDVTVGFGQDSRHFEQVRTGLEIQRYWDNDGTAEGRVRDVLLLGVEEPFEIDGTVNGHHIPLIGHAVFHHQTCAGWDTRFDPESPTHQPRLMQPAPLEIENRDAANLLWWTNTNVFDPMQGDLLMPADTGAGCFYNDGASRWQTTVHSDNPTERLHGGQNVGEQAYSTGLWEPAIHDWVASVLFRELPPADLELAGVAAVCSVEPASLELFGSMEDGHVGWYRRVESEWVEQPALDPPPGISIAATRPGVLCRPDGLIELVITGLGTSGLWRRTWLPDEQAWSPDWTLVPGTNFVFPYGVSLAGVTPTTFHLLAVSEWRDLLTVVYENGWTSWSIAWSDLVEAPAVAVPYRGLIHIFARDANNLLWHKGFGEVWSEAADGGFGESYSNPALTSWSPQRRDLFAVRPGPTLHLVHLPFDSSWGSWSDTFIDVPEGELNAVSRRPASVDVFISQPGAPLFHVIWPRPPQP